MTVIRISAPAKAKAGEVIELKAMIQHDMESGFRRDMMGEQVPRDIIKTFECTYNDVVVFSAEFFPAVAANPFLAFHTTATRSGNLQFTWIDQHGASYTQSVGIEVS